MNADNDDLFAFIHGHICTRRKHASALCHVPRVSEVRTCVSSTKFNERITVKNTYRPDLNTGN